MKLKNIIIVISLAILIIVTGNAIIKNTKAANKVLKNYNENVVSKASEIVSNDIQDVTLTVTQKPVIDIVLAKSKTDTDLTNFKQDLLNQLDKIGVNEKLVSIVNVSAIETQTSSVDESGASKIFKEWSSYDVSFSRASLTPSLNTYTATDPAKEWSISGDKLQRNTANSTLSLFVSKDFEDNSNVRITTEYGLNKINSSTHGEAWYFFKIDESLKNGYGLVWDNHSACGPFSNANYKLYLIKMENGNVTVLKTTTVESWANGRYWDVDITIKDNVASIKVTGTNSATWDNIDVSMSATETTQAFGTFAFDGSYFSNNTVTREKIRKLSEVLREPNWTENALRVVVPVEDIPDQELVNDYTASELITRLLNDNIYIVPWGKEEINKEQFERLILSNNSNGYFVKNTNYSTSIEETAQYIKTLIDKLPKNDNYILLNEPLGLKFEPEGVENDTADEKYPYGKWKVEHDYTYFENDIGQFADSGKYLNNFVNIFNKTGKYVITYADLPITPTEIFVHRRPIAQIDMKVIDINVELESTSYDLDEYSKDNKGISEEEWKWKATDEDIWHEEKLTTIDTSKSYIIQLRVKDNQQTWSEPASKYITSSEEALPVAMFNVVTTPVTIYTDEVKIEDQSYDPAGKALTTYLWEVYKDGNIVYSGEIPKTNFKDVGIGTYVMYLTVTNESGKVSERVSKTIEVIDDTIAPEFVANPLESDWARETIVHVKFKDEGGSGFKSYQYAITDSQSIPKSYEAEITNIEDDIVVAQDGLKYLHIIATDNAKNVSENRVLGIYKIDRTNPDGSATITQPTEILRNAVINFTAIDNESGVAKVVKPDNTETTNKSLSYDVKTPGTYTFKVIDNVGNEKDVNIDVTIVSDGVVVKHVDLISNQEIEIEQKIDGNVGEAYTTAAIEKEGYKLVSTSEKASGNMEIDKIEVVYGYKKISEGVDVKYIDQVTKEEIADLEHFDGLEGERYEAIEKEISGYELVNTPSNVVGNMTDKKLTLTYEYRKQSKVIVKYVDENSNEEIEIQTTKTYKEGDTYETLPKNKEGYVVTTTPENKDGTVERKDIEVTYGYKKISEGLIVKYVDEIKNEILDTKLYEGNEADKITLEEKEIEGYVVSRIPEVTEVYLTPNAQEVTYYYKKKVITKVIGIDANNQEEIYNDEIGGIEGDSYEATGKEIEGYKLVEKPQTETIVMDRDVVNIIYKYKKISQGVIFKYLDDYSGEILDQYKIEGLENDEYTSEKKEYEKYSFVNIEGNPNGNMLVDKVEVIYHYEKKDGVVQIRYIDEDGKELFTDVIQGKVDNEYKVKEKEVKNYRIKEYPENLEGIYTLEKQVVTYVMEKIPGKIVVNLKDEEGNVLKILDGNGFVGEEYEVELPEIEGYYVDGEKNLKVAYEDGEVVIDIVYKKLLNTGDIAVIAMFGVLVLSVIGMATVVLKKRKLN